MEQEEVLLSPFMRENENGLLVGKTYSVTI